MSIDKIFESYFENSERRKPKRGYLGFDERYEPTWEFKLQFIKKLYQDYKTKTINETKCIAFINLIEKMGKWENRYGKDVYEFNEEEIKAMLRGFYSKSVNSLLTQKSNIEDYLLFARDENRLSNTIPVTVNIDIEDIKMMINNIGREESFIIREELYELLRPSLNLNDELESGIYNAMDRLLVMLVFEGIMGKELIDIRNIEWKNIDFDKKILKYKIQNTYKNKNGETITDYKDKELDFNGNVDLEVALQGTIDAEGYFAKNGTSSYIGKNSNIEVRRMYSKFTDKYDNKYLFRPLEFLGEGKSTLQQLQPKALANFKLYMDKPHLTLKSVYLSGLIERAIKYTEEYLEGVVMTHTAWSEWLKDNDEHVSIQVTMELYHNKWKEYIEGNNEQNIAETTEDENWEINDNNTFIEIGSGTED